MILNSKHLHLVKKKMLECPYILDESRRGIVLKTIIDVCKHRQWGLLAAHIRTNHVHIVVHAMPSPEQIMGTIKSYASRHLNEAKLDGNRKNRWTRHDTAVHAI